MLKLTSGVELMQSCLLDRFCTIDVFLSLCNLAVVFLMCSNVK